MSEAKPALFGAVGISVSDLKRSEAFYRDVMGMKSMQTFALDHMDEIVMSYDGKGAAIVLMQWKDGQERVVTDLPIKLVFYVPDPKATAELIRAAGLEIVREPTPIPSLGGAVVGFGKDPDGYLVELLQRA
jgi:lactoylglutathione lyase